MTTWQEGCGEDNNGRRAAASCPPSLFARGGSHRSLLPKKGVNLRGQGNGPLERSVATFRGRARTALVVMRVPRGEQHHTWRQPRVTYAGVSLSSQQRGWWSSSVVSGYFACISSELEPTPCIHQWGRGCPRVHEPVCVPDECLRTLQGRGVRATRRRRRLRVVHAAVVVTRRGVSCTRAGVRGRARARRRSAHDATGALQPCLPRCASDLNVCDVCLKLDTVAHVSARARAHPGDVVCAVMGSGSCWIG